MNNSYIQTLKNLQRDQNNSKIIQIASKYSNYQQFLRRRPLTKTIDKSCDCTKYCYNECHGQTVRYQPESQISTTAYYPVERTEIGYKDVEVIEQVPRTKKIVEYVQKKQIQMVPKQVIKTDYYAVQHLRHYEKVIVPEKRVQMVKVPKTVKKVDYVPQQKQIIYYPNHLKGDNDTKSAAKEHLGKLGVVIQQNAEYKSINLKTDNVQAFKPSTPSKYFQQNLTQNVSYPTFNKIQDDSDTKQTYKPYFSLSRRKNQQKSSEEGRIPIYQKQNYDIEPSFSSRPQRDVLSRANYDSEEYSFAQKDQYRYNMAVNNSFNY